MRWTTLLVGLVLCLAVSLLLSALTHSVIFLGILPLLFVPFAVGRRRSGI